MPDLDKLHEHVKALDKLLCDRQEELSSWRALVGEYWKAIVNMWWPVGKPLSPNDEEAILLSSTGR